MDAREKGRGEREGKKKGRKSYLTGGFSSIAMIRSVRPGLLKFPNSASSHYQQQPVQNSPRFSRGNKNSAVISRHDTSAPTYASSELFQSFSSPPNLLNTEVAQSSQAFFRN